MRTILLAYALLCEPPLPFSFTSQFLLQILATAPIGLCARSCSTLYSDALYHEYLLVMTSLAPDCVLSPPSGRRSHETCIQRRVPRHYVHGLIMTRCNYSKLGAVEGTLGPSRGKVMLCNEYRNSEVLSGRRLGTWVRHCHTFTCAVCGMCISLAQELFEMPFPQYDRRWHQMAPHVVGAFEEDVVVPSVHGIQSLSSLPVAQPATDRTHRGRHLLDGQSESPEPTGSEALTIHCLYFTPPHCARAISSAHQASPYISS